MVLLSSASIYLGRRVQSALTLDHILCSEFEVGPDGKYTGDPKMPVCYGPGKLVLGRQYLEEQQESLADATFYTDSMSDLPMMEAVGHPVAVNPDPRLRRHAHKQGWPNRRLGSTLERLSDLHRFEGRFEQRQEWFALSGMDAWLRSASNRAFRAAQVAWSSR